MVAHPRSPGLPGTHRNRLGPSSTAIDLLMSRLVQCLKGPNVSTDHSFHYVLTRPWQVITITMRKMCPQAVNTSFGHRPSIHPLVHRSSIPPLAHGPSIPPLAHRPSMPPLAHRPAIPPLAQRPSMPPLAHRPAIPPLAQGPSIPHLRKFVENPNIVVLHELT